MNARNQRSFRSQEPSPATAQPNAPLMKQAPRKSGFHLSGWEMTGLVLGVLLIGVCITVGAVYLTWRTVGEEPHSYAQSSRFALAQRMPSEHFQNKTSAAALPAMAERLETQLRQHGDPNAVVTTATPAHMKWMAQYNPGFIDPKYKLVLDSSDSSMVDGCSSPESATVPVVGTGGTAVHYSLPGPKGVVLRSEGAAVWGGLIITSISPTQVIDKAIENSNEFATKATSTTAGRVRVGATGLITTNTESARDSCTPQS